MKRNAWRVAALAILTAALVGPLAVPRPSAFACSCAFTPVASDVRLSDTVFSGEVLRVGAGWAGGYGGAAREVVVAVDHVWIGNVTGQATVITASSGASCGYESFVAGERFLIYAKARGDVFETNLCSPTRPYTDAAVKLLEGVAGPGVNVEPIGAAVGPETTTEPVATAAVPATRADSRPWLPIAVGSAGAIAVAALGFAAAFRWRHTA